MQKTTDRRRTMNLNLKKELETYFYNKGFGSESAQEAPT